MMVSVRAAFCAAFVGFVFGSLVGCGSSGGKAPAAAKGEHFEGDGHDHSHDGHDHKEGEGHK